MVVQPGENIRFNLDSRLGTGTGTVTVRNVSDGNAVLATFAINGGVGGV
jgi:hypothetical protein